MSIRAVEHVLYHIAVKATPAERWLLVYLADKAGAGGGRIFTSQARLVAWTGFTAGTVERFIQLFKQRGWLLKVEAKARGQEATWRLAPKLWKSCGKVSCPLSCGRTDIRPIPNVHSPKRQPTVAAKAVAAPIRPLDPSLLEGKIGTYVPGLLETDDNEAETPLPLRAKMVRVRPSDPRWLMSGKTRRR